MTMPARPRYRAVAFEEAQSAVERRLLHLVIIAIAAVTLLAIAV